MTIGIGLVTKDYVLLAADSAVTHGRTVDNSQSSLGEQSDTEKGIEESALKIVSLGSHAAAAMAGTASHAVDAIAWFKPLVQAPNFEAAWASAMSVCSGLDFVILLARYHQGIPELYRCDGNCAVRVRPGRPAVIGSVREEERVVVETRTRLLLVRGHRPQMIQLSLCAFLFWRSLNEPGFKDGVGGAPASLLVDAQGTAWMPDASFYSVDARPGSSADSLQLHDKIHRVSVMGREQVVAVASTYTNQTRLLSNPSAEEKLPKWRDRWMEALLDIARRNDVKLVALVGIIHHRLAVLELELCQDKYILVKSDTVTFGEELKAFFLGPPASMPGSALYCIPTGEPPALAMVESGGPRDEYDVDLGAYYVTVASMVEKKFDEAFRVWESMINGFPTHPDVLTVGVVAMGLEPGSPRLDRVLTAWENALVAEPNLIEQARFVATKHPEHPDVSQRLLAAVRRAEAT